MANYYSYFDNSTAGQSTRSNIKDESATFGMDVSQDINCGIITATTLVGDGSGLTGIVGSGSGIIIKDGGSTVGTAGTINFAANLSVTPIHLGIVTVTASGGGGGISTQFVAAETLTVAGVSTFSGNVIVSGSNLTLGDSSSTSDDRIVIGSGSDLHIFHNALDSHIDNNTGNLILRANVNSDVGGNIKLMPKASENGIIITHDASVELYENNVKKLETTSSGISVSGTCVATTFSGSGASLTDLDASNLSSGTVPTARLGSGTADNTKFLRGDNSWQTVSAGGSLGSRGDTSATTGSIAQNASADITIPTGGKSFSLLKVTINAPAWVVLYVSSSTRSSDSGRTEGTDPAPGSGVLTEVSTTTSGSSTFLMSPAVLGWNNDGTPASQIYAKVKNKRSNSGSNTITVTLTTVALET